MISVLLPVYNGGDFLKLSVVSVLNQTFTDFELLIMDDSSTDHSYEYLQGIEDPRVKLFQNQQNKGLFYNLNFLAQQSSGDLLKLWTQDDIMLPDCLKTIHDFHLQYSDIGFSYCQPEMINEKGELKTPRAADQTPVIIPTDLHTCIAYYTGSIAGNISNTCINKKIFFEVGQFDEQMKISADFDIWVRIAQDHTVGHINKKLIQMRDHDGQLSRNVTYTVNHILEDMRVYQKLDSYASKTIRASAFYYFKNYKLIYYYTIMLKLMLRGEWMNVVKISRAISKRYSLIKLSFLFVRRKIFKKNPRVFSIEKFSNSF